MKRIALLFLLLATPLFAQLEIRPTTAGYRYETIQLPGINVTNWFIDFFYGNLPQGRTYQRQLSTNGVWTNAGEPFFVPIIPDAMASHSEGINLLPPFPPIYFYRLTQVVDPSPSEMKLQTELVMKDQPEGRTWYGKKVKKFRNPVTVKLDKNAELKYTPRK